MLLLVAAPEQSASDPRVRFWEALVTPGMHQASGSPSSAFTTSPPSEAAATRLGAATAALGEASTAAPTAVTAQVPEPPVTSLDPPLPEGDAPFDAATPDFTSDTVPPDFESGTVGPPPTVFNFTVHPRNDATVVASKPNAAYGTAPDLRARGARAEQKSYLEFEVHGAGSAVQQATLRLYCMDGSDDGGSIFAVARDRDDATVAWTQEELSWNNAPPLRPAPHTHLGRVVAGSWVEIDVTAAIGGNGTYGFALVSSADDMVSFAAREGPAPPELVFTTAIGLEDGNTLPVGCGDAYTFENDGVLESYAPGLLENDTDLDGDVLALVSSTQPAHGVLVAMPDGSFTYRAESGYFGPDSFTYCVSDGRGGTSTSTVAITVQPGVAAAETWAGSQKPAAGTEPATQSAGATRIVPNPSRGNTWVEFDLHRESHVDAAIYDARGHRVRLLAAGSRPAGRQQLPWNGTNDQGGALPAGIYFLRLQLGETLQRHKIVLQR